MQKTYSTKMPILKCKKILSDKIFYPEYNTVISIKNRSDDILFKTSINIGRGDPGHKYSVHLQEIEKGTMVTLVYKGGDFFAYFGMISTILFIILVIAFVPKTSLGFNIGFLVFACLCVFMVWDFFSSKRKRFEIVESFLESNIDIVYLPPHTE